jgi:NAD(P)-dependent dehydrogenase (short-subunit alcohol dehydrogenase family)
MSPENSPRLEARTIAITGSGSGMGAATAARLTAAGHRVIGVDLHDAEVIADLGTAAGRAAAVDAVAHAADGRLDAAVTFAGVIGLPSRPGAQVTSVNYFGTVEVMAGLRPLLAAGDNPAAVCISSNSTTVQPRIPVHLVEACNRGDEEEARRIADEVGGIATYAASKMAICRWVRRHAPTDDWIRAGITLNAIAPGYVDTPMTQEGHLDPEMSPMLDMFPVPVGRPGRADEIAALTAFLIGPEARFFCGSVVFCDGGSDAKLRPDDWPAVWNI